MEVSQPKVPSSKNVWYNSTDGNYLKPRLFGVPVYTILGGYDPVNQVGLIYPAAKGNWGNVFNLSEVDTNAKSANCWLNIQFPKSSQNIALAPQRVNAGSNANKFHINLAQVDAPQTVNLYCRKANEDATLLSSITIPAYEVVSDPYVEIGKQAGYSALRAIELPRLEQALLANKGRVVMTLSAESKLLLETYQSFIGQLSADAQKEMLRYNQQQEKMYRLNRWMNVYSSDLHKTEPEAVQAFNAFVEKLGLTNDLELGSATPLMNRTHCLKAEQLESGVLNTYISGAVGCSGDDSEKWIYDANGKIHNKKYIGQCLTTGAGNVVNLLPCGNLANQIWIVDPAAQAIKQSNQCFDLEGGYLTNNRARLIRYACTGGSNQKWTIPLVNNSLILAELTAKNLVLAEPLLRKDGLKN